MKVICRYPRNPTKRFRCGNSSTCVDERQICNAMRDCPLDHVEDEKILCPWQTDRPVEVITNAHFTCKNNRKIHPFDVCDGYLDCPDGEDERFCNITRSFLADSY